MNETVNKFFLVGYKYLPDLHLRQAGFTKVSGFMVCSFLKYAATRVNKSTTHIQQELILNINN